MAHNSWPFREAERILQTFGEEREVIFSVGYGPSGLPHIGTFGEVVRTAFVANALRTISPNTSTRILAFSDDMDGLRKVPENIPQYDMVAECLGKPLTSIPDPFGTCQSYGHHMNHVFCEFLDRLGIEYEFKSATECYKSGVYDATLLRLLQNYDRVTEVLLATVGEERQKTYSPFLPICTKTSRVLQVPIVKVDIAGGTVFYEDDEGNLVETPVTGGRCKLQWKADWGMRWAAFDVRYEAHGKDLTPSARPSSEVCKILGKTPPVLFTYELFLDREGKKISKSKGNGFSVEEWLACAPYESLALYMFQNPGRAKRLYFDIVPKFVDDYLSLVQEYNNAPSVDNPVWHIHSGKVPKIELCELTFCLLINIASACNAEDDEMLWKLIRQYRGDIDTEADMVTLGKLVSHAIAYCHMFVIPNRSYRIPNEDERIMFLDLADTLAKAQDNDSFNEIQNLVFAVGKKYFPPNNLREWFKMLYEVLLGQSDGPRFGSFVKLYGVSNTVELIRKAVSAAGGSN
ncbi:lysine--tRNA ligase [Anaplasma capra]|uniref:lysine--tRNA ligase n=1 Tax=Anaplasma capra TaxID=1562740 RepID=UPI0021D612E9|nr:lysine--tRNA ligase [Anaplasma capra]MCU7611615.1 lysine--tRNA ligase [Anaplasma capra]MCU7612237.1 lysine--tRNA ligase [Anaplasma capra]